MFINLSNVYGKVVFEPPLDEIKIDEELIKKQELERNIKLINLILTTIVFILGIVLLIKYKSKFGIILWIVLILIVGMMEMGSRFATGLTPITEKELNELKKEQGYDESYYSGYVIITEEEQLISEIRYMMLSIIDKLLPTIVLFCIIIKLIKIKKSDKISKGEEGNVRND